MVGKGVPDRPGANGAEGIPGVERVIYFLCLSFHPVGNPGSKQASWVWKENVVNPFMDQENFLPFPLNFKDSSSSLETRLHSQEDTTWLELRMTTAPPAK